MNKIITKPSQCADRVFIGGKYFCNNPKTVLRYCTWINEFPDGCPLPSGYVEPIPITFSSKRDACENFICDPLINEFKCLNCGGMLSKHTLSSIKTGGLLPTNPKIA
jgi:hypothetical protein